MAKSKDHAESPPPSFIYEWLPFRVAAATQCNLHYRQTQRTSFVAGWQLWAAPGLRSSGFAVPIGMIEITNQLV